VSLFARIFVVIQLLREAAIAMSEMLESTSKSLKKPELSSSYSQLFDSNGNSTLHPTEFFELVFEISIRIVFFALSKVVHPLHNPFTSVYLVKLHNADYKHPLKQ